MLVIGLKDDKKTYLIENVIQTDSVKNDHCHRIPQYSNQAGNWQSYTFHPKRRWLISTIICVIETKIPKIFGENGGDSAIEICHCFFPMSFLDAV